jgi:cell division protein FtsW
MAQKLKTDWILFAAVLGMVSFGVLILYSASSIMAQLRYGSTWHFVARQVAWAAVAVVAMMTLKRTHYRKYQNPAVAFSAIGLALVLLAGVYLVDTQHHRWLRLGPIGLQPSELAKPALVIFLAFFVTWRARAINNPRYTLVPAALAVGLVILAVVVADLGTAVVLGGTAAIVFFVAGLELRYCAIAAAVASIGVCIFVATSPYRLARVVKFFDPEFKVVNQFDRKGRIKAQLEKSLTTRDTNYQLQQSKIAVGAGGPAGVGLMNGKQKLLYLPEAHTDFIYAVASEELGMIGSVGLLAGFFVIFWRGWRTSLRMNDDFGRYLALGVTAVVVVQGLINMSVVLGMMPTKGIPLPMISSGGSSLLSTLASLGILMNVSEHAG